MIFLVEWDGCISVFVKGINSEKMFSLLFRKLY